MMGNMGVAKVAAVLMLVVVMAGVFVIIPKSDDKVDAVGAPAIKIELASYRGTALVAPGQDGIVQFSGTVTAQIPLDPNFQFLLVYLTADAGGWPASTSSALTFSKQVKTQNFQVVIRVPPETSVTAQGQLTISGRWRYSPGTLGGSVEPVGAIIVVKQFYQFSVGCDKPYVQINPGASYGFKLRLTNEGNFNDKLTVDILNLDRLTAKGWTIQLSRDKFEIMESTEQVLVISVTSPLKFTIWKNNVEVIQLRTTSTQAELNGEVSDISDYALYIRERGINLVPGFEVGLAIIIMAVLATAMFGFASRKRLL